MKRALIVVLVLAGLVIGCGKDYITRPAPPAPADSTDCPRDDRDDDD